jgi:hypothetical protein
MKTMSLSCNIEERTYGKQKVYGSEGCINIQSRVDPERSLVRYRSRSCQIHKKHVYFNAHVRVTGSPFRILSRKICARPRFYGL